MASYEIFDQAHKKLSQIDENRTTSETLIKWLVFQFVCFFFTFLIFQIISEREQCFVGNVVANSSSLLSFWLNASACVFSLSILDLIKGYLFMCFALLRFADILHPADVFIWTFELS